MRRTLLALVTLACCLGLDAQNVRCESMDGEYRECFVASSGKIILVRELSDLLCVQGVTWGTASDGRVWVQRGCRAYFDVGVTEAPAMPGVTVICESMSGGRSFCSATPFRSVTLVRQLSSRTCVEGGSWGYDPERGEIWVDQGCRGEFRVGDPVEAAKPALLDAIVICESEAGRRKVKCEADTSAGVQLHRVLGETRCRFEEDWGYDRKQIWVRGGCRAEFAVRGKPRPLIDSIVCESAEGRRTKYEADTTYGVAIVRELGEVRCVMGETWGFDDDGIWVDGGCSGQFALGGFRLPADAIPQTAARVVCESTRGTENRCEVDTSRGVGLVQERGDVTCVLNRNWVYDRNGIVVLDGCSAEFAVAR